MRAFVPYLPPAKTVAGSSGGGGFDYIGADSLGAYAVTALKTGVTRCFRVRRSSDNTEQDCLTVAEALAFCGGGSGFVVTWYDQSGSLNVTNSTTTQQPRIISSGVADAGLVFDGSNDSLSVALSAITTLTIATWVKFANTSRQGIASVNGNRTLFDHESGNLRWFPNTGTTNIAIATGAISGTWHHLAVTQTGLSYAMYLDGASISSGTTVAVLDTLTGLNIGSPLGVVMNGIMYDFRLYSTAKSAAEILAIKQSVTPT